MDKALEALDENLQSALSWLIVYARRNENYGENQDAVQHNAEMQKRYDLVLSALTQSSDREAALRALLAEAGEVMGRMPTLPEAFKFTGVEPRDLENMFDAELRHKTGQAPVEYLKRWLPMFRPFAFATRDDSWGELEKLISITMRNYVTVLHSLASLTTKIKAALDEQ